MPDNLYIVKNPKLRESKDYALLRAEGLTKLERLASTVWTDYNVHDPGITFLELLCYAITELGYRTGYDIKDLLTHEENGTAVNTSNFHTAKHIFTSNPVTFNDLRKLLIDIEGVRNAWVEKHTSVVYCLDAIVPELVDCPGPVHATENEPVNGLYDVFIEYDDFVEQARIVRFGRLERDDGVATAIAATNRGLAFRMRYPMTLEAVSVYADAPGPLTLRLLDDDGIVGFADLLLILSNWS